MRGAKQLWIGVLLAGLCTAAVAAGPKNGLNWQKDIFAGHQESVRTGKPMLLVFGADWCVFCKKLEQTTLAEPEMVKYVNDNFVPVHLDVDRDKKVASILEIKSLPCTVVLSPDADVLGRIEGFAKAPALYKQLAAARKLQSAVSPASGSGSNGGM
jgi:thioredoxin-related protein